MAIVKYDSPLRLGGDFAPKGDQGTAIAGIVDGLDSGYRFQTLLVPVQAIPMRRRPSEEPSRPRHLARLSGGTVRYGTEAGIVSGVVRKARGRLMKEQWVSYGASVRAPPPTGSRR